MSSGTWYGFLDGHAVVQTAITNRQNIIASAGTISHFGLTLTAAPGATKSWTAKVFVNGVASGIQVVISNTDTSGSDIVNTAAVNAGDLVSVEFTATNTPASAVPYWSSQITVTTALTAIYGTGGDTGIHATATRYNAIGGVGQHIWTSTQTDVNPIWAIDATITAFYVNLNVAPGAGVTRQFTIMKNGSAEASSVITVAESATTASVTGLTIDIAPGDNFDIRSAVTAGSGAATTMRWGIAYLVDKDREFNICGMDTNALNDGAYVSVSDYSLATTAIEANRQVRAGLPTGGATWKINTLMVEFSTAPGAGNTRTLTLREDGASTGLAVTISETDTTGTDSVGSVAINGSELLTILENQTGTPSGTGKRFALLCKVDGGGATPPGGGGGRRPPGSGPPNPPGGGSLLGPVLKKLRFPEKVI